MESDKQPPDAVEEMDQTGQPVPSADQTEELNSDTISGVLAESQGNPTEIDNTELDKTDAERDNQLSQPSTIGSNESAVLNQQCWGHLAVEDPAWLALSQRPMPAVLWLREDSQSLKI